MTTGLLLCDYVAPELRPAAGGNYAQMIQQRFGRLDLRVYDLTAGVFPTTIEECDGYLTSGSRYSVYDDEPWIHRFAALIRRIWAAEVPYVGICFGHQMIAHALGGRVERSATGWGVGVHSMPIVEPQRWMQPAHPAPRLYMSCQDQIRDLPPGARCIAAGATVEVSMLAMGRSIIGTAGHPEFSDAYAAALYRRRRSRVGEEAIDTALASVAGGHDAELVVQWITRFLIGSGDDPCLDGTSRRSVRP